MLDRASFILVQGDMKREQVASILAAGAIMTNSLARLRDDIIKGYDDRVVEDLKLVLDEGSSSLEVINSCVIPAMIMLELCGVRANVTCPA